MSSSIQLTSKLKNVCPGHPGDREMAGISSTVELALKDIKDVHCRGPTRQKLKNNHPPQIFLLSLSYRTHSPASHARQSPPAQIVPFSSYLQLLLTHLTHIHSFLLCLTLGLHPRDLQSPPPLVLHHREHASQQDFAIMAAYELDYSDFGGIEDDGYVDPYAPSAGV
jgi:hypothetical protein